jgi:hypothetical protein
MDTYMDTRINSPQGGPSIVIGGHEKYIKNFLKFASRETKNIICGDYKLRTIVGFFWMFGSFLKHSLRKIFRYS